jgi:MoaA/NifB/PqqE/SkfB family radical SAM enzyme
MYLTTESIEELHVEVTNKCNAACPMCDRNIHGGPDRPSRGLNDWNLEDIEKVFTGLPNLRFVYFCGTHGEPLASKHIFEAIHAAKTAGAQIEMFTNGSLKTIDWWHKLVSILDKKDRITFGVDGIETNHLYRQNTDINRILERMQICCDALVRTRWDFLVFKHNEHEMETCKQKAQEMGVQNFRFRRTARFDRYDPFPVLNNDFEVTHYLEPPENPEWRHPSSDQLKSIAEDLKLVGARNIEQTDFEWEDRPLPNSWKINCLYQEAKKIYVNNRLEVFPCCYISDEWETYKTLATGQLKYPIGELSLRNKTWQEILNHKYFAKELVDSWQKQNVPPRCIRTCSVVRRETEQNVIVDL